MLFFLCNVHDAHSDVFVYIAKVINISYNQIIMTLDIKYHNKYVILLVKITYPLGFMLLSFWSTEHNVFY